MNYKSSDREINTYKVPRTLFLIVDINTPGGVSNYYRNLKLDAHKDIDYLTVTKGIPQSAAAIILRLIAKYCIFVFKVLRYRYEIVVVNPSLDLGKSFHRDMMFIILTKLMGRKSYVFFRGWFDPYEEVIKKSRLKKFLFRISYARADKYIVLGNIFKNKLLGLGVPPVTEFFIETTVADSKYMDEFDLTKKLHTYDEKIIFLFLARIEKDKGIFTAIDAYSKFRNEYWEKDSCLVIAGDGPDLESVREYVSKNNLQEIIFLGSVSNESKKKVLFESNIMIFPTLTEGLPNSILEGMLHGMPVISRTTGGIPEIVHQGVNGYLTDSFDPEIYKNFMLDLATNRDLYIQIAENNHQVAKNRFTVEKVRERILNILVNSIN
jgi:glycosyltransferase involved in cell wall biosynthesis